MVALSASVSWWAHADPARLAIVFKDQRVSYAELYERVCKLAGFLAERGVRPGDVVALLMKNSSAFVELALAVSHVGAVLLPINYRLGTDEVTYIVDHSDAKLLFVDTELTDAATGCPHVVLVDEEVQRNGGMLAHDGQALATMVASTPETLFRLMYTSGTTDRPKGVMHTYANYFWKCADHISALGLKTDDRILVCGPLYHVGAFDLPGLAVLMVGGCLAILRDFDEWAVLTFIDRERLTGAWMAPVMLNRLLMAGADSAYDLTSLKWIVGGGDRTPEARIREFKSLFKAARYVDAYGLTETCSGDTMMDAGREIDKIGSAGRAVAHVDIDIRDDDGRSVGAGATGEICLRGPKVSSGYWKDPERTAASRYGDWFRTGDVGYLDDDGFLFLTDRKKDMIISGGENIASSEVERVLYQMPEVLEAAAIGLPDARWGERVAAIVALRMGAVLTLDDVRRHCEGKLGGFKTPKQLVIVEALPRNPSGKVLKRVLRDDLSGTAAQF